MMKDFFREGPLALREKALTAEINKIILYARGNKHPVIWIRQEFEPDLSDAFPSMRRNKLYQNIRGTEGVGILDLLDRQPHDHEIVKKRYSAFFGTGLETLLGELKVKNLVVTGINTHACVRMAAIDAYQRDFQVIIPKNAVASYDEEHHRITMKYLAGRIAHIIETPEEIPFLVSEKTLGE
jgi:nicotinamidase-related amidase